jgi:glucans biosynthesis protein C
MARSNMSETSQALKNLRAAAVLMVVSFHSVLAYLTSQSAVQPVFDSPPYAWLVTPILDSQRWLGFDLYAAFQYVSLMPLMFLLSGIFVWPSLTRKGSVAFLYHRLLRIGLPFALGVYLLMPIAYYPSCQLTALDPGWLAYLRHLTALPFWPCGPLWFLAELLLFDIAAVLAYLFIPRAGDALNRLASAGKFPIQHFAILVAISAAAYVPLAFLFGTSRWSEFGPFALQPDRVLLYAVYFFAGVGIGIAGYDRGLLRVDGMLARRWYFWLGVAIASFSLWMASMAPLVYGHSDTFLKLIAYFVVVLAVASACFAFLAIFLRFATGQRAIWDSLSENAYTIFLVHYVFVVWLQYALFESAMPAFAKGALVFSIALGLSWTVVVFARIPLTARLAHARNLRAQSRAD